MGLPAASPSFEWPRTVKGAFCGALAATVWALAQPLDKLFLASGYDDVALLGRAVTQGEQWYPIGLAMHLMNGATFGSVYAKFAPAVPLPPALRGPAAALAEHLAFWPLAGLSDRFHPARDQLPTLAGNRRAFAQATWRHLLFGTVLGELERRLNADAGPDITEVGVGYSSNGRGSLDDAMATRPTS